MENNNNKEIDNYQAQRSAVPTKQRGRGSVMKHDQKFKENFMAKRRAELDAKLQPELAEAYSSYLSQHEQGTTTSKVVPITTRGVGFHTKRFLEEADNFVIESVKPLRADVNQLYRYSLMQLARQMCLIEPTHTHVWSQLADAQPTNRVSAFSSKTNGSVIADAINQVGKFVHNEVEHVPCVPNLAITYRTEIEEAEGEPDYDPQSPGISASPAKRSTRQKILTRSIPDPYTLTIFNLKDAVDALANPLTPRVARDDFIKRNPIPGAMFNEDSVLTNPGEIMPVNYREYANNMFSRDISACQGLFRQVQQSNPCAVGEVVMDGRGSVTALTTSVTKFDSSFNIYNGVIWCNDSSQNFAVAPMDKLNRLRGYVGLMNEIPLLPSRRTCPLSFAFKHPDQSVHSSAHSWTRLVSDVSPFYRRSV